MKNGKFIVLEGLDASGKDTQGVLLHQYLNNSILGFAPTRDGELQKTIRKELIDPSMSYDKEELFLSHLMFADRLYQTWNKSDGINKIISIDKKHYISIRYSLSSEVYNSTNFNISELLTPDILIFLDILPEESLKRITARSAKIGTSKERYENLEKLTETRKKYLEEIHNMEKLGKTVLVIDANQEISKIFNQIKSFIDTLIKVS